MMVNMEFLVAAPSPIAIMGWTLPLCVYMCVSVCGMCVCACVHICMCMCAHVGVGVG